MLRRCHKGSLFAARIREALGVDVSGARCHVVDEAGMTDAMKRVGWAKNEADGVVGFQVGNDVFVRNDSTWTTLHELIHKAGVNADRINRFVAEGLVEVIAARLARAQDEHRPTYPEETAWVKTRLLPKLGIDALELGRRIAHSSDPPKLVADLLIARDPSLGGKRRALIDALQAQRPGRPDIGMTFDPGSSGRDRLDRVGVAGSACGCGSRDEMPRGGGSTSDDSNTALGLGAALVVAGVALALPAVLRNMERGTS